MTRLRRRMAGLLARWAVRIDPDPALSFDLTKALVDALSGQIVGHGVAGRKFKPGEGTDVAY